MAGVTFTVDLSDIAPRAAFSEMEARAGDLSPLMDQIGALVEQTTRDRIESTNLDPDGVPWPPSLRAREDGGLILFESGRLAASITHEAARSSVAIGSNLIYAGTHQAGATIVPKTASALQFQLPNGELVTVLSVTIPARPYLGISNDDAGDIEALAADYVFEPLGVQKTGAQI